MTKISINLKQGDIQREDFIVGIDLGTTNSLIAFIDEKSNQPFILKEDQKNSLLPSVIFIDQDGSRLVGEEAKKKYASHPLQTISSIKRLMGKSYKDIAKNKHEFSYDIVEDKTGGLVKVNINGKFYTPTELSSFILQELKERAERMLKTSIQKAVITVPAYYDDTQRQAVKDAGRLAGLDVLRIINEPTAASLAYGIGLDKDTKKTVVVYDLGGGTFDVSVLQINGLIFEVLSTKGNTFLGGDDIDTSIAQYWKDTYGHLENIADLKIVAEEAKKVLSKEASFQKNHNNVLIELDTNTLEKIAQPLVQETISICEQAIKDAKIRKQDIDEVLLVGGSTRMPIIKKAVATFFDKEPNETLNPDEVVALGAAVQANVLAGKNKEVLLLDVTPLSLGIETAGGLMDVIIPRNTTIPSKAMRTYSTQKDGQVNMRISVYQGERDLVVNNRKLSEFILKGIPPMPAGLPKIDISFLIDADGILMVKAKEQTSGISQEVEVKPQYGITDEDIENALKLAIDHAKEDIQTRSTIEACVEAETLIQTSLQFIEKNKKWIAEEELSATHTAIQKLQSCLSANPLDKEDIVEKTEELNQTTKTFAERVMNISIQEALKGKHTKE